MKKWMRGLLQSFRSAIRGLLRTFHHERTFQFMVVAALVVCILLSTVPVSRSERLVLLLMTGLLLVLELMNTMVERLVDLLKPRLSEYVRDVKDFMAASVLVAAIFATIIGIMIFLPYFSLFLRQI